jgi:hypothetical protein
MNTPKALIVDNSIKGPITEILNNMSSDGELLAL